MQTSTLSDQPPHPLPGRFANTAPIATHVGSRGAIFLYRLKSDLVCCQVVGHLEVGLAERIRDYQRQSFRPGRRVHLFHDWAAMTSYDSASRSLLTEHVIADRALIGSVVLLTQSRLVAMGVATANLATSAVGVTLGSHTKRETFEQELLARAEG